jgi:hypothetical protein
MADYTFDPDTGQYKDADGHPLTQAALLALSAAQIEATSADVAEIAAQHAAGDLTKSEWEAAMRDTILAGFVLQFLLGRGGVTQMTDADWAELGDAVQAQYDYLDEFAAEIADGALSEAEITARSNLYAQAQLGALWKGFTVLAVAIGMTEESWHLGIVRTEHCVDCEVLEAQGWVPLGQLPQPGTFARDGGLTGTICGSNCKCWKEFRVAE